MFKLSISHLLNRGLAIEAKTSIVRLVKATSRFQRILENTQTLLDEKRLLVEGSVSKWRRHVHFWVMVWRSFTRNRCPARASALAYGTLLALIPMLAVVVGVTSTFLKKEGEDQIDQFIVKFVASVVPPDVVSTNTTGAEPLALQQAVPAGQPVAGAAAIPNNTQVAGNVGNTNETMLPVFAQNEEVLRVRKEAAKQIHEFIQNTRSSALGVTGSVLLIFVAISMLTRIEDTFNDIWGVARGRSWFMRIVLYWGVISLAPLLLILTLGLATGPHLEATKRFVATLPVVGHLVFALGFEVLPVLLLCLAFAVLYMLIPNTKVHWGAALVGGLVGGLLFHLNNLASVLYVSRVVSNSRIYGSLGLVPVFMIGLYCSWLILLFGAQVAYAYQNRSAYLEEKQIENINQRGREFIALRLLTLVGQRFVRGEPPPSANEMAEELNVPTRLVSQLLQTLCAARLVVETAGPETAFLPARPMETINCHDILQALRASQGQELATRDEPARAEVYGEYQRIQEAERRAAASVSLLALVNRAQAQLPLPTLGVRGLESRARTEDTPSH